MTLLDNSKMQIVQVYTDSKPIAAAVNYATQPGIVLFNPAGSNLPILSNSPFNSVNPIDILNTKNPSPIFLAPLPDLVQAPIFKPTFINTGPPLIDISKIPIYNMTGMSKVDLTQLEGASANFIQRSPQIIFISDYIVDGNKIGNLIVFNKYLDSSHYEILKKNLFTDGVQFPDQGFQRILFLDATSLAEETNQYKVYLGNHLGLDGSNRNAYYAVMDPLIKDDRIYEYKIIASKIPKAASEVDYDFILKGKNLLNTIRPFNSSLLGDIAISSLGSRQLSWIIALLTRGLNYFGPNIYSFPVSQIMGQTVDVHIPQDMQYIKNIFDESVSLFGIDDTLNQLLDLLGGLTSGFRDSFNESLNHISHTFSYSTFINSARRKVPVFNTLLTISEHANNVDAKNRLTQLNLVVPEVFITVNYSSIEGLTDIFSFVNSLIFSIEKSQENSDELQAILTELNTAPAKPPLSPPVTPPLPIVTVARPVVILPNPIQTIRLTGDTSVSLGNPNSTFTGGVTKLTLR